MRTTEQNLAEVWTTNAFERYHAPAVSTARREGWLRRRGRCVGPWIRGVIAQIGRVRPPVVRLRVAVPIALALAAACVLALLFDALLSGAGSHAGRPVANEHRVGATGAQGRRETPVRNAHPTPAAHTVARAPHELARRRHAAPVNRIRVRRHRGSLVRHHPVAMAAAATAASRPAPPAPQVAAPPPPQRAETPAPVRQPAPSPPTGTTSAPAVQQPAPVQPRRAPTVQPHPAPPVQSHPAPPVKPRPAPAPTHTQGSGGGSGGGSDEFGFEH